jgi:hypothetical protein
VALSTAALVTDGGGVRCVIARGDGGKPYVGGMPEAR